MLDSENKDLLKDKELLEQFNETDDAVEDGWLKATLGFIVETVKIVVLAAAIILPIRFFLIQPFYVKGASMEPNFFDKEYLMINELGYRIGEPERGDVVVFRYPRDPKQYFIKRVIGLPGDVIELRDDAIYIAKGGVGVPELYVEDVYLPKDVETINNSTMNTHVLQDSHYFLLGDNRYHSLDSRSFGSVDIKLIIGKVWFRGWPLDRIEVFN